MDTVSSPNTSSCCLLLLLLSSYFRPLLPRLFLLVVHATKKSFWFIRGFSHETYCVGDGAGWLHVLLCVYLLIYYSYLCVLPYPSPLGDYSVWTNEYKGWRSVHLNFSGASSWGARPLGRVWNNSLGYRWSEWVVEYIPITFDWLPQSTLLPKKMLKIFQEPSI